MSDPHADKCSWILDKIRDFAGEHCDAFVFIAQVPDADDDSSTPMVWGGGFNQCLGMAERAKERLIQKARDADATEKPGEDDGDDWKAYSAD